MFQRTVFNDEQNYFRETVTKFVNKEVLPHHSLWEKEGIVPKEIWLKAGDLGILCPNIPKEYGGIGASSMERIIWANEEAKFDVPKGIFEIGLGMCGPVMMEYATEDQKERYLPPMAEGKEIWCQLFSEPSAGSDVAG